MLKDVFITIKVCNRTKNYYHDLGYDISEKEEIKVKSYDIKKTSGVKIPYMCDYCGKEVWISSKDYYKKHKNDTEDYISKDACNCPTCMAKKREENYIHKTGYKSPLSNPNVREKGKQTFLKKYGKENYLETKEYKEKMDSFLKKYNVNNVMQIQEVKEKVQNTMLSRYGVVTNLIMEDKKEERRIKGVKNRAEANHYPVSKNQINIHNIVGGELNKAVGYYCVDILFEDDKIYIEYDGSGHDLEVKRGITTKGEFMKRASARYNYLKKLGYKKMTFENLKEHKLPSSDIILQLKKYGFNILSQENYNWIVFNFDTKEIKTKFWTKNYEEELNLNSTFNNI